MSGVSTRPPQAGARAPKGTAGKRCYAIGDVHGRLDLLVELLQAIQLHNADRPTRETAVVLLGDLVDRGPDSRGVLDYLLRLRLQNAKLFVIAGNHEELMLRALRGDMAAFRTWMTKGGQTTLQSYGLEAGDFVGRNFGQIMQKIAETIPSAHVAFLRSSADSIRFGDYLLVHAGVRPGVSLAEQTASDLHWIRQPFLDSERDHGFVIIHGHSKRLEIEERHNRIGIDTGAYQTGVLTAIWLEDERRGYLQTNGAPLNAEPDLFG